MRARRLRATLAAMGSFGKVGFALLLVGAAGLTVLCFLWPLGASLAETIGSGDWSQAALGQRRLGLLGRGLVIAAGASIVAHVLGGGLAEGLQGSSARGRLLTAWICLLVVLTPPYVYAYAWSLALLPEGAMIGAPGVVRWPALLVHEGRAIWCLGTWVAPVAAAVLACGWRASGRPAYRLALLDARPFQALVRVALPALAPWLAVGVLATSLLVLADNSVCDLCQAPTWNTEVLATIQNRLPHVAAPASVLAWPLAGLVAVIVLGAWFFRCTLQRLLSELTDWRAAEEAVPAGRHRSWLRGAAAGAAAVLVLAVPWIILLSQVRDVRALRQAWATFGGDWSDGLLYAAGTAVASACLALGADGLLAYPVPRRRVLVRVAGYGVLVLAALAAVTPPALIGDAFVGAYISQPWLSDYWPIVSLVAAARFAVIPILALRVAGRRVDGDLAGMAATDGAGWVAAYFRVRLPECRWALLAATLVVGLLSLTEVPATQLVRPPGVRSVAITLFNEIHNGRSDQIIAMTLCLIVCVGVVVSVAQWLFICCCRSDGPAAGSRLRGPGGGSA